MLLDSGKGWLMNKAYLIAQFDVSGPAPKLSKMGIFSEPEPTTVAPLATWQTVVAEESGKDYETAYWRLVDRVARSPRYSWTRPYVRSVIEQDARVQKLLQQHGVLTFGKSGKKEPRKSVLGDLLCAYCGGKLERAVGHFIPSAHRCTACGTVWRIPVVRRKARR